MRDGQWHEVSIPLPPATYTELEDAKTANGLWTVWTAYGNMSAPGQV